ncbi:hypothetical protein HMPREF0731_4009 [Pseudoroseomonas cervicalis ATCC 49957]|uniref:Uncharacterized protein n=1 Tax=Pseudoroseomonas cervicalis ATCC 49957 TaxID=525371 RepID=D5RSE7_9PROT|nr:hypothetical protein HMPREF0731_4009 [Pseudoroseomonas cervicalis ATCC 49957]
MILFRVLFCKKEPKNFFQLASRFRPEAGRQTEKSLFASFSSEKEDSYP